MPELPDIEVFKQYLDSTSLHQEIESVEVRNDEILGDYCPACQPDGREDGSWVKPKSGRSSESG